MRALLTAISEIWREIVHGDLDADSTEPGNVKPASFAIAHSPAEIADTFDAATRTR